MTADPSRSPVHPALNASLCPLCGQVNQCAMELEKATGQPQPPCWCTRADVTFGPDLLARVPEQARQRACICARCAQASVTPNP